MNCNILTVTSSVFLLIFNFINVIHVTAEFENQPQLFTQNGNLIVEGARNQNITIRMLGDAAVLKVNDENILPRLKKLFSTDSQLENKNGDGDAEILRPSDIVMQIKILKRDLQRLSVRLANTTNRSKYSMYARRLRRISSRISRAMLRLSLIEIRLAEDVCAQEKPCKNGGMCYNQYKNYYCECPEGWKGKSCEEDVDECYMWTGTDLGCQNNAICINTPGSYRCNCTTGFYGTHCRLRNAICESPQSAELCGNGVCVPANNQLGYSCLCNQGWMKDNKTTACTVDVDECEESRNPCHDTCINLPGSFKCGPCPQGYSGNGRTCVDINECAQNNGGCSLLPRVQCINTEGSYHCGNCPPGWLGDGHHCEKAQSSSCDREGICHPRAKCVYISDTVVCTCQPGWYGHGFGSNGCSPGSDVSNNPCDKHECKNNATCVVAGRGTRCICPLGFAGPLCEINAACNPNPCRNGGTCNLLPENKYRCTCLRGTTGSNCEILRNTCGSILNQEAGELSYPPDDGNYEYNERCAWIIKTARTKVLNVTFSRFDLEESAQCSNDWLQIHDGNSLASQLIGRFCGKTLPLGGSFVSSHNQLFLWFRSDNATNGGGLKMSWISQEHTCGGDLELKLSESGVIRSPGYPGKSPANRECEWRLNAPYGTRLIFRIYEVNLGGKDKNCSADTLKIFDSDQLLEAICSTQLPEPKHTSSNIARVHFHTDSYRSDSSFQLHYEVVAGDPNCGGVYIDATGTFGSNIGEGVCLYLIQQPIGTKIKLEFPQLKLMHNKLAKSCILQKIEIFDGKTDDDTLLKKYCPGDSIEDIVSSDNTLLVRYELMITPKNPSIYQAKYSQACDESFFGPIGGVFASPNYPNPYYDHISCTYNIYGPLDTIIHVNFTDFAISETVPHMTEDADGMMSFQDVDNFADYVDVYISHNLKRRYYKGEPMHLVSSNNRMTIVLHSHVNQRRARGFRVEYSFETISCGGVLTENEGSFSKYELNEGLAPNCEWILEAPEGKSIKLDLNYGRRGAKCATGDVDLLIYLNGTISGDRLVASYCDMDRVISTTYNHNLITIRLNRIPIEQRGHINYGLTANYSFVNDHEDCGGVFDYKFGVIKSPAWPQRYPAHANCTWFIVAPLGHKIEVVVHNFSVETQQWEECSDDYLEIRDGYTKSSPLIGKYCGESIPNRVPSFSNILRLHFHSDSHISDKGFYLTWQQTATGCGGKLNSHTGSIHSPFYPTISIGAVVCDWTITVAQGSRISLTITPTQGISNLCHDNVLSIYDGPNMLSRPLVFNCSIFQRTINLKTTSNQAFLRYSLTDSGAQVGQQFMLDYKTDCVVEISDMQGVVESPNFPDKYPPSMNCAWDIRGRKNNHFAITFSHLYMERDNEGCKYDYFEVIDMRDEDVLKTHHMCHKPTDIIISEGNRLMLKFVTDYSISAPGFHVEYKQIGCGEHLHTDFGYIESPNAPYSVDVDCDWYIEVSVGKQIVLKFEELHMETESSDCSADLLIVSNEKNSSLNFLKVCQISQTTVVTSLANRMYIHFHTSTKRARKYFKASYSTRDAACGGVFVGKEGSITSPNYPEHYLPSSACLWSIISEQYHGIDIQVVDFDLPASNNCEDTYVQFQYPDSMEHTNLTRHCGSVMSSNKMIVQKKQMDVYFQAGTLPPKSGFALQYKWSCGGDLYEANGYLKSNIGENCSWTINAEEGAFISLTILHLECSTYAWATIVISLGENVSNIRDLCKNNSAHIYSSGSQMILNTNNVHLRAQYSAIENACGGTLTSLEGHLASPYYPNTYPSNVECVWEIKAAKNNSIELNFEMLNITSSDNCNQDYVEIRTSESGKLLGLFCSNELPTETLRSYDKVWIKFRSVDGSTGGGFNIRWNYAHFNLLNGTAGVIEAPPISSLRLQAEPYFWRITVTRDNLIQLNFLEYYKGLYLFDGYDEVALPVDIQYSPWQFTSSSNVVLLRCLNSEVELFKIEWKAVSKQSIKANTTVNTCHMDIVLPPHGHVILASPEYPEDYAADLNCDWIITLEDPTQHAVMNVLDADIEDTYECQADYLTISSSRNLQDWQEDFKFCNKQTTRKPPPMGLIHGTPNLKVNFRSDSSISGRGFRSLLISGCGSNMTAPVGTILFSHLLENSIFNSTCLWHIEVRAGRRIEFTFDFGNKTLSLNEPCPQYAIIYDGVDESAAFLEPGQICNRVDRKVHTVMTTSNHAVVKYNMSWIIRDGDTYLWDLTYREYNECGGEVELTHDSKSANISTPNYPNVPHPFTECSIIVIAPAGESIQVEFVDHFDMNARYCSQEYVEFFDGATELAHSLGRYCTKPDTLRTTGNALYIHYITALSEPRSGFRINVSISLCGGTATGRTGEITSSGYPAVGAYLANTHCDYRIKLPEYSRVKLNFTDIHLPYDGKNLDSSDRLEIYGVYEETNYEQIENETQPFAVVYGNISGKIPIIEVDSNEVLIRFKTFTANHEYRGFKLKYERTHSLCLKEVSGETGILTLGRIVQPMNYIICRWKITVPKGQRVRLEFFNMPAPPIPQQAPIRFDRFGRSPPYASEAYAPNTATIIIYNNLLALSSLMRFNLFDYNASEVIQSSDNTMLVRIQFGKSLWPLMKNLRAKFSSAEDTPCPDDIKDQISGTISLDRLTSDPKEMGKNFYCKIQFTLNHRETIAFTISEMKTLKPYATHADTAVRFQNDDLFVPMQRLSTNLTNYVVAIATKRGSVAFMQSSLIKMLKFTATYKRHRCGGQFDLTDGLTITMPDIQDPNYGSLDCAWVLQADSFKSGFQLLVNVTLHGSCDDEYIYIYATNVYEVNAVVKICRDSPPFNSTELINRFTTLIYHVRDYKQHLSHFSLKVEKSVSCGSTQSVSLETGKSINVNGKTYRNNMDCSWDFITIRGLYLTASFTGRFFIEDSVNCSKDYLEIQHYKNGLWQRDERLCGRSVPVLKTYNAEHLRFIFHTDANTTADGFNLQVMATCNATFNVTTQTQTIQSPVLYILQPHKSLCIYKLYSENKRINVRIIEDSWHLTNRCELMSLTAYKRSNGMNGEELSELGKYCSEAEFGSLNFLQLNLDVIGRRYVRIQFELESCGGSVTAPTRLRSPKSEQGDRYMDNMECIWNITAPAGHSIALVFKQFEMEPNEKCLYDYLAIYSGPQILDEEPLSKLCGNMTGRLPPVIMVDNNQAIVEAISDESSSYKGFVVELLFTQNCNERITLTDGNSPLTLVRHLSFKSSESLFCHYNIMAPVGYRIKVEIKDLQLGCTQSVVQDCERCNHIVMVDSVESERAQLDKFCATGLSNVRFLSSFEDMMIKLIATQPGNYSFELVLQMFDSMCGGRNEMIIEDTPVRLRYPMTQGVAIYPPNTHCVWHISSKSEFVIEFDEFALQEAWQVTGKCIDYVRLKIRNTWQEFCGNFTGYKVWVPKFVDAKVDVLFHSDAMVESKGFQLTFKHRNECNQTYNATSGFLTFSRPATESDGFCTDEIRLPNEYSLSIIEYGFNTFPYQNNCTKHYVKVIDIVKNVTLEVFCRHRYAPNILRTSTNAIRLEYTTNKLRLFYMASKYPAPPGCGGDIYTPEGLIENPPYDMDHNSSECRWNFTVPSPNKIRFIIDSFDMGSSVNCALDNVSFIEIANDNSERVTKTLCGQESPNIFVSESSRVAILAKKSPNFNGIGFRIIFETYKNVNGPQDYWSID